MRRSATASACRRSSINGGDGGRVTGVDTCAARMAGGTAAGGAVAMDAGGGASAGETSADLAGGAAFGCFLWCAFPFIGGIGGISCVPL
jgi:hypothetical protein